MKESDDYILYDRMAAKSAEEKKEMAGRIFTSDYYFIRSGRNTRGFSREMNCHNIVSI